MKTLPAFPNQFPYYELLLCGLLSAKTRTWKWSHTGWTLFYTSKTRAVRPVMEAYDFSPEDFQKTRGCLVGIGYLLPVRKNTAREIEQLKKEFNNFGRVVIRPGWARYEFNPCYAFGRPIPFSAPRGAVTTFKVPVSFVAGEIKRLGITL